MFMIKFFNKRTMYVKANTTDLKKYSCLRAIPTDRLRPPAEPTLFWVTVLYVSLPVAPPCTFRFLAAAHLKFKYVMDFVIM